MRVCKGRANLWQASQKSSRKRSFAFLRKTANFCIVDSLSYGKDRERCQCSEYLQKIAKKVRERTSLCGVPIKVALEASTGVEYDQYMRDMRIPSGHNLASWGGFFETAFLSHTWKRPCHVFVREGSMLRLLCSMGRGSAPHQLGALCVVWTGSHFDAIRVRCDTAKLLPRILGSYHFRSRVLLPSRTLRSVSLFAGKSELDNNHFCPTTLVCNWLRAAPDHPGAGAYLG